MDRSYANARHGPPGFPKYSGGQRVALDLIRGQSQMAGLEPQLCVLGHTDPRISDLAQHRIDYMGGYNKPSQVARAVRGLRRVLRAAQPDIVHTHSWDSS